MEPNKIVFESNISQADFLKYLDTEIQKAECHLKTFRDRFEGDNTVSTLYMADHVVQAANMAEVCRRAKIMFEDPSLEWDMVKMARYATKLALNRTCHVKADTNSMAVLNDRYHAAAWGKIAQLLLGQAYL